MSDAHVRCPYYRATKQNGGRSIPVAPKRTRRRAGGALLLATVLGIVALAAGVMFVVNGPFGIWWPPPTPPAEVALAATATATVTATSTPTPAPTPSPREDT
ncbi:MAG: hypothetical protein NZ553_01485, partial [Caldilinea sp.]|nr:hypothetical protein [Caldilinea sp.]MDW8439122.1 hypothetical protein [Caldilineaceae bacterium]